MRRRALGEEAIELAGRDTPRPRFARLRDHLREVTTPRPGFTDMRTIGAHGMTRALARRSPRPSPVASHRARRTFERDHDARPRIDREACDLSQPARRPFDRVGTSRRRSPERSIARTARITLNASTVSLTFDFLRIPRCREHERLFARPPSTFTFTRTSTSTCRASCRGDRRRASALRRRRFKSDDLPAFGRPDERDRAGRSSPSSANGSGPLPASAESPSASASSRSATRARGSPTPGRRARTPSDKSRTRAHRRAANRPCSRRTTPGRLLARSSCNRFAIGLGQVHRCIDDADHDVASSIAASTCAHPLRIDRRCPGVTAGSISGVSTAAPKASA